MRLREPGELISSSPLMRTVSVPYCLCRQGLQHADGVNGQRDAALVVGDAQAIGAVALHAVRLRGRHAALVDRVHVGDEENALGARATEGSDHRLADLGRRVLHLVGVRAGCDELHLPADGAEAVRDQRGGAIQPLHITAARLDRHQLTQGVEVGRPLLPRAGQQFIGPGR